MFTILLQDFGILAFAKTTPREVVYQLLQLSTKLDCVLQREPKAQPRAEEANVSKQRDTKRKSSEEDRTCAGPLKFFEGAPNATKLQTREKG